MDIAVSIVLFIILGLFAFIAVMVSLRARKDVSSNAGTIGRIESDTKTIGTSIDATVSGVGKAENRIDTTIQSIDRGKESIDVIATTVEDSKTVTKRYGNILDDIEKTGK
jgi:putative Mn2+ efflux pump MntP